MNLLIYDNDVTAKQTTGHVVFFQSRGRQRVRSGRTWLTSTSHWSALATTRLCRKLSTLWRLSSAGTWNSALRGLGNSNFLFVVKRRWAFPTSPGKMKSTRIPRQEFRLWVMGNHRSIVWFSFSQQKPIVKQRHRLRSLPKSKPCLCHYREKTLFLRFTKQAFLSKKMINVEESLVPVVFRK